MVAPSLTNRGTVLITGASGGLGGRVLGAVRAEGWRARALVHSRPTPEADEEVKGDLTVGASLEGTVEGVSAVVHMAAVTHARRPGKYLSINRDGTAALLAAAQRAGVRRFVYVSTRAISADGGAYSRSKRAAENEVRTSGLEYVILRLSEVICAGSKQGADAVIARARRGRPIPVVGSGDELLCPVHVDDVVPAIVAALDAPAGRTHTLAGECLTVRDFATTCSRAFGSESRIVTVPMFAMVLLSGLARIAPLPLYPDQVRRLRAAKEPGSTDAKSDLGFAARSLAECLRGVVRR